MDEQQSLPEVHEAWLPKQHPLHRPRHGGLQIIALVCALVFFAMPAFAWTVGMRAEPIGNRPMAPFPSVSQGWGFFTGLSPWASDHMALREQAVGSSEAVSRGVFGEAPRFNSGHTSGPIGPAAQPPKQRPPGETSYPNVIEGKNGWLYLGHDVSYKCEPKMDQLKIIKGLREWRRAVESSGRKFVLTIPPDKTTMHPENLPDRYAGKQCSRAKIQRFWNEVPRATGAVDLRPALRAVQRRDHKPVYHDIDTHWTHAGAATMVYQLAERIDPGVTSRWRVAPGRTYEHSADIPDLYGHDAKIPIQAYELAPDGGADNTRFVASDFREPLHLKSESKPGMIDLPVRMVGDSFSQFAIPYFAASFSDLGIVHADNVGADPSRWAHMLAEGDVVVMELSERFVSGGRYSMLDPAVARKAGEVLRAQPVR